MQVTASPFSSLIGYLSHVTQIIDALAWQYIWGHGLKQGEKKHSYLLIPIKKYIVDILLHK